MSFTRKETNSGSALILKGGWQFSVHRGRRCGSDSANAVARPKLLERGSGLAVVVRQQFPDRESSVAVVVRRKLVDCESRGRTAGEVSPWL